jgi:hypothetical protein
MQMRKNERDRRSTIGIALTPRLLGVNERMITHPKVASKRTRPNAIISSSLDMEDSLYNIRGKKRAPSLRVVA